MNHNNFCTLERLQEEIQPILNKILNNSPELKNVLEKYGLLEAVNIQLQMNTDKLEMQDIELRTDRSQIRVNTSQLSAQAFSTACCSWCVICGDWRRCGTCPGSSNQC